MAVRVARAGTTSRAWSLPRQCRRHLPWTPISPAHVDVSLLDKQKDRAGRAARSCEQSAAMLRDSRSDPRRADSSRGRDEPDADALRHDHKKALLCANQTNEASW